MTCKRATVDPVPRFWAKVCKDGPIPNHVPDLGNCWVWMGSKRKHGHGYFHVNRKPSSPHRFSYELHHGPIPDGLGVLHKCDNGSCVNPKHLFVGTQLDNMGDCSRKGRNTRGENTSMAILSDDDVREIRRLYDTGTLRIFEITKLYPVNRGAISKIVHRQRWTHVK